MQNPPPVDVGDETSAPPADGLRSLQAQAKGSAQLSPAQQRFNKLLVRLESLQTQYDAMQALQDRYRSAHLQTLEKRRRQCEQARLDMLWLLHRKLQHKGLFTAAQQRYAQAIVRDLLDLMGGASNPALAELCAHYIAPEEQAERAMDEQEALQELRDDIESFLGKRLPTLEHAQSAEEMMAELARYQREQAEKQEERRAARRAKRPPTARQQKAEQQVQDAKAALRTIFRQLASALHPDREPDPAQRERKNALMGQANAAYERNDLSALLRLQLQVAQIDAGSIARMAEEKIQALSLLLKEQVAHLEHEADMLEARVAQEMHIHVDLNQSEAVWQHAMAEVQNQALQQVQSLQGDLARVQNDAELKRWLKEQNTLAKRRAQLEAMGMDAFFE